MPVLWLDSKRLLRRGPSRFCPPFPAPRRLTLCLDVMSKLNQNQPFPLQVLAIHQVSKSQDTTPAKISCVIFHPKPQVITRVCLADLMGAALPTPGLLDRQCTSVLWKELKLTKNQVTHAGLHIYTPSPYASNPNPPYWGLK